MASDVRFGLRQKRVYDPAQAGDGARVLVDRLWPRGIRREALALAAWLQELAPSSALRHSFDHRPERYAAFREAYLQELAGADAQAALQVVRTLLTQGPVTLLTAARLDGPNHVTVLVQALGQKPL